MKKFRPSSFRSVKVHCMQPHGPQFLLMFALLEMFTLPAKLQRPTKSSTNGSVQKQTREIENSSLDDNTHHSYLQITYKY